MLETSSRVRLPPHNQGGWSPWTFLGVGRRRVLSARRWAAVLNVWLECVLFRLFLGG